MKRIILLILICIFCFGCQAKYELYISEDLSVSENITGLETDTFYNNYYKSTKERVIGFIMDAKSDYLDKVGYYKEVVRDDGLTGGMVSKKFSSLEEFFDTSLAYTQFYDKLDYKIKNGVVTISLKNQLLKNEDSIDRYSIDDCKVTITLPFKVKKSNADYVTNDKNTYVWELNGNTAKDIYIKFDTQKMSKDGSNEFGFIPYIFVATIISVFFIVIYIIYNKNKTSNKI